MLLQLIAARMAHHKQVPSWLDAGRNPGQDQVAAILQSAQVFLGYFLSAYVPFIKMLKFHAEEARLNWIESGINTFHFIKVSGSGTVVAQNTDTVGDSIIVRHDSPCVAKSA